MSANLYKSVKIGEREFKIKKFDAKTGLKLARLVIAKLAPMIPSLTNLVEEEPDEEEIRKPGGKEAAGSKEQGKPKKTKEQIEKENAEAFATIGAALEALEDEDLDILIDKCLRVCYETLPDGDKPVMDEAGKYLIEDIEYSMGITIRLCIEAILWGASDFFAERSLNLNQIKK